MGFRKPEASFRKAKLPKEKAGIRLCHDGMQEVRRASASGNERRQSLPAHFLCRFRDRGRLVPCRFLPYTKIQGKKGPRRLGREIVRIV